jgi:hypothetical protein
MTDEPIAYIKREIAARLLEITSDELKRQHGAGDSKLTCWQVLAINEQTQHRVRYELLGQLVDLAWELYPDQAETITEQGKAWIAERRKQDPPRMDEPDEPFDVEAMIEALGVTDEQASKMRELAELARTGQIRAFSIAGEVIDDDVDDD